MSAYQAVRARPLTADPARHPPAARRRRLASPVRAGRRTHPAGLLLAGVLLALMIGLIYVAQTIHLAGLNYEMESMAAERDDLARRLQTVETTLLRWAAEPMVLERAQRAGMDPLGARTRIPAR